MVESRGLPLIHLRRPKNCSELSGARFDRDERFLATAPPHGPPVLLVPHALLPNPLIDHAGEPLPNVTTIGGPRTCHRAIREPRQRRQDGCPACRAPSRPLRSREVEEPGASRGHHEASSSASSSSASSRRFQNGT